MYRADRGRVHKSGEYKAWLKEASVAWLIQKKSLSTKHIKGRYCLEVLVYSPDKRHRDLGNLEKAISDFLQMVGVIENDRLSKRIVFEWSDEPHTNPCVEVAVIPYPWGLDETTEPMAP